MDVILDMAGNDILPSSVTGTTQDVKEVKVTATRSNTDTNYTQGKLTNPSVQSTTTGSRTSAAEHGLKCWLALKKVYYIDVCTLKYSKIDILLFLC